MKKTMFFAALAACAGAMAQVELGTPFGDNAVLQRDRQIPVWGTAEPGEQVSVEFAGQKKEAKTGADGKWRTALDPLAASKEGRTLSARAASGACEARNVLVGEVWFASGQSNMECPIWGDSPRYRDCKGAMMIAMTRKPLVRFVKNPRVWSEKPKGIARKAWRDFTPASFAGGGDDTRLSAVAYYYALELHNALDMPVGIVDSSWGGTNIDAWTPKCGYESTPELADVAAAPFRKNIRHPHQQSGALWNAMVDAWTPMAMRGFIWYQGCSNNGEAHRYCSKMHALYDGWSKKFENPGLKLYFVELAPFKTSWFRLQQAQAKFAAEEKNAALAVVSDAGNLHDIHPNDKEIVAKRLALHALKRDYGFDDICDDSPVLENWRIEGDAFVMTFKDAKSWYVYNPDYTMDANFEIAGRDGKFVRAKLQKVDNRGVVRSGRELRVKADGVAEPRRLRYLFKSPYRGSLYSDASLPLGPFEIDGRTNSAVRTGAPVKLGDAAKIPELEGYRKIWSADLPAVPRFADNPPTSASPCARARSSRRKSPT